MAVITLENVKLWSDPGIYRDEKLPGFILHIGKTGIKTYRVNARVRGAKPINHTIGRHGVWNAKTAREEAARVLRLMQEGADPREERRELKEVYEAKEAADQAKEEQASFTLRRAFEEWCSTDKKTKESTKVLYRQVMFKHLHDWLDKPMANITAKMCEERYLRTAETTLSSANNCFRALRRLFNWHMIRQEDWAAEEQIVTKNPVRVLQRHDVWEKVAPRSGFITKKELPYWWAAVESLENPIYKDFFRFLIVTGLRLTEASRLRFCDLNFEDKVFTCVDTKNRRPHTLPMTPYTMALLKGRPKKNDQDFVFPAKTEKGYFRDARHWIEIVTAKSALIIKDSTGQDSAGVEFTCHELRRTFSNYAQDANLTDGQRKQILNHKDSSDVTQTHYSSGGAESMREPLQRAEAYILNLAKAGDAY